MRFIIFSLLVLLGASIKAQIFDFSPLQSGLNIQAINPAYQPFDDDFELKLSHWNSGISKFGLSRDRNSDYLSIVKKIDNTNFALGTIISNFGNRTFDRTSYLLNTSYQLNFTKFKLSFGLQFGFIRMFHHNNFGEFLIHENDPVANSKRFNTTVPDFNAGFYLSNKKTKMALSIKHLLASQTIVSKKQLRIPQTVYAYGEHSFIVSSKWKVIPSLQIQLTINKLTQIKPNITFRNDNGIFFGIQTENIDYQGAMVGLNLYELISGFSENVEIWFHINNAFLDKELRGFGTKKEFGIAYKFNFRPNYKKVLDDKIIDSPTIVR